MKFCWLAGLFLLLIDNASPQEVEGSTFDQDFFLRVDNDAFLAMAVDRYYSSGIFFSYRRKVDRNSFIASLFGRNSKKTVYSLRFSHIFYTPSDIKLRTIDQFDRPYAGIMSGGLELAHFFERSHLKLRLEAGVLGPSAKMQKVQEWYHEIIRAKKPRGWRFQIENSPLLSFNLDYLRSLHRIGRAELLVDGELMTGTVFNYLKPGLTFRWGNFKSLENTMINQSRLGSIDRLSSERSTFRESFFFVRAAMQYVIYDATIEGSLFRKNSLHTEQAQAWRYHIIYGYMLGLRRWDLALAFNNVRRETRESRDHYYVTIDVFLRF